MFKHNRYRFARLQNRIFTEHTGDYSDKAIYIVPMVRRYIADDEEPTIVTPVRHNVFKRRPVPTENSAPVFGHN